MTQATVAAAPHAAATPNVSPDRLSDLLTRARPHAATAVVLLSGAWWLLVAPRLIGGRGAGATTVGAALTTLALLASRPHQVLPRRAIGLAVALSAAAMLVAATAPTGWSGASNATDYVCVAWTVVAVAAAVIRERNVVEMLLFVTIVGAVIEIAESWLAWWGGGDASHPMVGTFYWWDPFAAYLIPGAVLGLSYFLRERGALSWLGYVGFLTGSVGLVYSTSRAADACYALAALIVVVVHVIQNRWSSVRRTTLGLAGCGFVVWAIAGPPFFAERTLPFQSTAARASGQSLSQNGGYRMDFWRDAVNVFRHHPLVGGGYHSLATESAGHGTGPAISPLAHSGYLQALSDGGLVLAVPFLLGGLAIVWCVLRSLARAVRARDFSPAAFVLPLVLGAMLAHSAVDFDWSYPADFVQVAVLAGLVLGLRWCESSEAQPVTSESAARSAFAPLAMVLAGVALLGLAAGVATSGDQSENLPIHGTSTGSTS